MPDNSQVAQKKSVGYTDLLAEISGCAGISTQSNGYTSSPADLAGCTSLPGQSSGLCWHPQASVDSKGQIPAGLKSQLCS